MKEAGPAILTTVLLVIPIALACIFNSSTSSSGPAAVAGLVSAIDISVSPNGIVPKPEIIPTFPPAMRNG